MGDAAAAEVLARFSDIVRAACGARHGRVVKQIGDEFMLVFFERRAAVACALDIDERSSNEPAFPAVRTGAHWGELLYREGDYIGATVNVAARLAAEARAHELLVTSSLADDARDLGAEVVPIGERSLKGISEDLELCSVRRAAPEHGERLVDPVCGMGLYPDDVAARLDSAGVSHVFCSEECLRRFVAAPDRFGG